MLQLLLTTLAGEEIQVVIDLQEFDRLDEFETAVLEQLPTIGGHCAFGSELVFVHKDTGEILANPHLGHSHRLQLLQPRDPTVF